MSVWPRFLNYLAKQWPEFNNFYMGKVVSTLLVHLVLGGRDSCTFYVHSYKKLCLLFYAYSSSSTEGEEEFMLCASDSFPRNGVGLDIILLLLLLLSHPKRLFPTSLLEDLMK